MSIEIRVLRTGDEAVLQTVAPGVFDDPIVAAAALEFLGDARHHLVVAVDMGVVVGFISGVHYVHPDKPRPEFWINEVAVAPTHQGRGVGRALMDLTLKTAQAAGCAEAWVLTERDNLPAMRLYASAGGEEAPRDAVMFTFRRPADA